MKYERAIIYHAVTCAILIFCRPAFSNEPNLRMEIPLTSPLTQQILAKSGAKYLYPQQFCLDEKRDRLFIIEASRGGGDRSQWAIAYSWSKGSFLTAFQVGTGLGETCSIQESTGESYLWVKVSGDRLAAFDVTRLPHLMDEPSAEMSIQTSLAYQATLAGDEWIIEEKSPTRTKLKILNYASDVQKTLTLQSTSSQPEDAPKRQALAAWGRRIVGAYGSNYMPGRDPVKNAFGIRIYNENGSIEHDLVEDPRSVIENLKAFKINASRLENEGVATDSTGEIFLLAVVQAANTTSARGGGLVFLDYGNIKQ